METIIEQVKQAFPQLTWTESRLGNNDPYYVGELGSIKLSVQITEPTQIRRGVNITLFISGFNYVFSDLISDEQDEYLDHIYTTGCVVYKDFLDKTLSDLKDRIAFLTAFFVRVSEDLKVINNE